MLDQLETIDDDAERTGSVMMVKVDDIHLARIHGITVFPSLTFFRGPDEEMILFEGDLHDEQASFTQVAICSSLLCHFSGYDVVVGRACLSYK